jgi:CheY-like chemotaxis protein
MLWDNGESTGVVRFAAAEREKLLLPRQGKRETLLEAARASPRTHGVLVVDDDEGVRGVLNDALRRQGFAVWQADDGYQALVIYWQHREVIDVVLMDVRIPGLDGPQTLATLQELNPEIRCCFMSGRLGDYTERGLREQGAAAVLQKPVHSTEVASMLWAMASHAKWNPSLVRTHKLRLEEAQQLRA